MQFLTDFDANLEAMEEAGVPLERVILYCTPAYRRILKNAEGIQRTLNVGGGSNGLVKCNIFTVLNLFQR